MLAVGVGAALSNSASVEPPRARSPDPRWCATPISRRRQPQRRRRRPRHRLRRPGPVPAQRRAPAVLAVADDPQARPVRRRAPTYRPAPGWSITVTPTVPGGTFRWILPDTAPAGSKTVATDADGLRPVPVGADARVEQDSTALVQRGRCRPGYTPGRPGPTTTSAASSATRTATSASSTGELERHRQTASRSTRSARRSSPARSGTPSTTPRRSTSTKVNVPTDGARRPRPAGDGHVIVRGHQPRQHAAAQRQRHRRHVRPGRTRCRRRAQRR